MALTADILTIGKVTGERRDVTVMWHRGAFSDFVTWCYEPTDADLYPKTWRSMGWEVVA